MLGEAAARAAERAGGAAGAAAWTPRAAIMAFDGGERELDAYLAAGCHIILDGALCDPVSDEGARLRALLPRIPLARPGTPEDAARMVRSLVLDMPYVTGSVLRLDGGRWLR
jgi:NAD(P)-dependent dehydrogenase (short-subunit alcohol dehydrogenase family)